jgi:hypothetical protein
MEKIEVGYREVGPGVYHKFIIYTDSTGTQWAASGWAGGNGTSRFSDVYQWGFSRSESSASDYGDIITTHGKYDASYPDHPDNATSRDQSQKREELLSDNDLSNVWKDITDAMDDIANEKHQYRVLNQNSNTTADEALERAGVPQPINDNFGENWTPASGGFDSVNTLAEIQNWLIKFGNDLGDAIGAIGNSDEWQAHISELVDAFFRSAGLFTQPRRDSLTLDLDGDGLETVGTAAGILFDHNADGIKTGTGWVIADDGFLVLDKNGNGVIDNGRELFGDNFIKANGQFAIDGFDALRSLDSNANGKIDAGDAQFGSLKVWRDLNQNGTTQSGELFTLSQLGIASINTGSTANSQVLPNGNQIADLGTYTKTDGSTGATAEVSGNLADINLGTDTFHRQFTDHLDTSAVANLPDRQACPERSRRGSGALRETTNNCFWRMAA